MQRSGPVERLRPVVSRTIATNTRLLETAPSTKSKTQGAPHPAEALTSLPGGVAEGLDEHMKRRLPPPSSRGERWGRRIARGHLKGLGWVGDAAELAGSKDKRRAAAGLVGGRIGGGLAAAIPPQLLTVPVGSVVGSLLGQTAYDHREEIGEAIDNVGDAARAKLDTLRDQLGRELRRYAPYDYPDRLRWR